MVPGPRLGGTVLLLEGLDCSLEQRRCLVPGLRHGGAQFVLHVGRPVTAPLVGPDALGQVLPKHLGEAYVPLAVVVGRPGGRAEQVRHEQVGLGAVEDVDLVAVEIEDDHLTQAREAAEDWNVRCQHPHQVRHGGAQVGHHARGEDRNVDVLPGQDALGQHGHCPPGASREAGRAARGEDHPPLAEEGREEAHGVGDAYAAEEGEEVG